MISLPKMLRRLVALALCQALILTSVGTPAYAAASRSMRATHGAAPAAPTISVSPVALSLGAPTSPEGLDASVVAPAGLSMPASAASRPVSAAATAAPPSASAAPRPEMSQTAPSPAAADEPIHAIIAPGKVASSRRIAWKLETLRNIWAPTAAFQDSQVPFDASMAPLYGLDNASLSTMGAPASPQPPAPSDGGSGKGKGWFGLGKAAVFFIGAMLVAQIGLEAWSAAWGKWVQTNYGLDRYALMTTVTMVISLAAGFIGGWTADKIGLKKTWLGTTLLAAAAGAAILLLFKAGLLASFSLLLGLAGFRVFMASASRTAEQTIPIAIYKGNQEGLIRFNSISQFILEIAGIAVPYSIGMMLMAWGSVGTMFLLPITAVAAAVAFMVFVKLPEFKRQPAVATLKKETDPTLLKIGSLAYPAFMLVNVLLYGIIAIGYGNFVHPGTSPLEQAAAAGVAGKIVALYSAGGLFAAFFLSGLHKDLWGWLKGKFGRGKATPQAPPVAIDEPEAALRSTVRWALLSAVGLAGFIPFLWTNPLLAALAMIPFGFTNVMAQLQTLSLVQGNVPQEKKGKVMGAIRTAGTLLATGGIIGFGKLFSHFPASAVPFWSLLGLLAVVGAYYVWIGLKLKRYLDSGAHK